MKYHMRRSERQITDQLEIESIISKEKYAIIGLSKDNDPYIVTLSYGYDKLQNSLYFHCAKQGQKIEYIKCNPKACVTIIEDDGFNTDSCEHSYKTLILRGNIQYVNDPEEIERGIKMLIAHLEKKNPESLNEKLKMGDKHYDNLQMLKFKIESITGKKQK